MNNAKKIPPACTTHRALFIFTGRRVHKELNLFRCRAGRGRLLSVCASIVCLFIFLYLQKAQRRCSAFLCVRLETSNNHLCCSIIGRANTLRDERSACFCCRALARRPSFALFVAILDSTTLPMTLIINSQSRAREGCADFDCGHGDD
jgi:hypothetical protein